MADISNFVHKFRASPQEGSGSKVDGTIKVQKRNRPVVSCLPCRNRKSKCDREHPTCGTCKGNGNACVYQPNTKSAAKSNPQDRLAQLESLVLQLMHSQETKSSPESQSSNKIPTPPADSSTYTATPPEDDLKIDASQGAFTNGVNGLSYVGPTHWEAVLDTINGLKSELSFTEDFYTDRSRNDRTRESLFSTPCPPNLMFVLQVLPARSVVDQLVSTYINARMFCMPIVHTTVYQRTYEKFWIDHTSVPILWISQLFSMLAIGSLLCQIVEDSELRVSSTVPPRSQFFRAAAQCLILANWERPQPLVVEAMFFYVVSKIAAGVDPACDADEIFALYGALVRQAYRLGYHREPSQIPGISVYEAEMRRRVWHIVCQFDVIGCLQLGLPCNVQDTSTADTLKPRNLLDTDFDEDSVVLPPARHETEITGMVYFIAKGDLMQRLKELLHRQISKKQLSYDEDIMELDQRLRSTYLAMPQVLRVKPISESYGTPSWLILNRLKVDVLYQKALCVLHRQHLDHNPRHQYSVNACVQASMEILKHQRTLHSEPVLGGQLTGNRWLVTSMHLTDFFLGAMVLGLILCNFDPAELGGVGAVEDMKLLMYSALAINKGLQSVFPETIRFSAAIEIILRKIEGPHLHDIQFDLQSFTGPTMLPTGGHSDISAMNSNAPNLQDLEGYFASADSIDWAAIDAGLVNASEPSNIQFNWTDPGLESIFDSQS